MLGLSWGEVALTVMVCVIIFGWGWIPRLGQGIGALFDGVKKGMREDDPRIVVRSADDAGKSRKKSPAEP